LQQAAQQDFVQRVAEILHGLLMEIDLGRLGKYDVENNSRLCRLVCKKQISI
jgi:hypothetical protein